VFLLEQFLNGVMQRERERFLQSEAGQGEQANGYYKRRLHLTLGALNLNVPRVRHGRAFRPIILPARCNRVDKDYEELLIAMLANGYSRAQMERALKALNLPLSEEALSDAQDLIREKLDFYKSQPLKSDWFAIFIDAYWARLRTEDGKVEEISLFVAVGIDLDGNKEVLGFWVLRGRENKGFWVEVLQDLISRGVHRVLLFVTDDFRGLEEVIQKLFPGAEHQFCLLHLERNLRRGLGRQAFKQARDRLRRIRAARDREEARPYFAEVCSIIQQHKPNWARQLETKQEHYLAFLGYPEAGRLTVPGRDVDHQHRSC